MPPGGPGGGNITLAAAGIMRRIQREFRHVIRELNPSLRRKAAHWECSEGLDCLRQMGVHEGACVVDYGCGPGRYSIPAARLAGSGGMVFAVDTDSWKLNKLRKRAGALGIGNLRCAGNLQELALLMGDRRADFILLFDVLHILDGAARKNLYARLQGLLADEGTLCVHPMHVKENEPSRYFASLTAGEVAGEIASAGFSLRREMPAAVWHGHGTIAGTIWVFAKGCQCATKINGAKSC